MFVRNQKHPKRLESNEVQISRDYKPLKGFD